MCEENQRLGGWVRGLPISDTWSFDDLKIMVHKAAQELQNT